MTAYAIYYYLNENNHPYISVGPFKSTVYEVLETLPQDTLKKQPPLTETEIALRHQRATLVTELSGIEELFSEPAN